jgi:lysophospholipase L1-like esterase
MKIPDLNTFGGAATACGVVIALLLLPVAAFPGDDRPGLPTVERALKLVRKDRIPTDAADQITAGYYEDLFDFSSRTIATNRLITGKWATNWSSYQAMKMNQTDHRVPGFVYFETLPNLDVREFRGRLVTNSYGMADREYSLARPEGTRRLTIIGDSISRGLGATTGKTFEALLEEKLNAMGGGPPPARYEILNFAVGGYRITQLLWVLQHKAAQFQPQVNIVVFTDLTVIGKWADHIVQLVHDGIDLHYPYLKELVERTGLRPDDDPQTFQAKLGPYREEVITWALKTMQASGREQGAELVVLIVPVASEPEPGRFEGIRKLVAGLNIPVVDVTDAFAGIRDLTPYQISRVNTHPTDEGHALLAERIFERLQKNPEAWKIITGR